MRRVSWTAKDGTRIEGLLVRRREDLGKGPLALALNPRGGPCWPYRFGTIYLQDAVALEAGYAVLLPNPRGTPGRGQAFARANIPVPGIEEIEDALAGVDALAAEGIVDAERVGIMGGSWAGYLTAWALTTRSERFRCAVMMYGLSNLVSWHRTSNTPRFLEFILQARPDDEEGVAKYMSLSPVTFAHRCRTPTLIISGELDECCPVGQQLELYQALGETGTEVECVLYPREGHASANWEHDHQLDYAARALAWLQRHLGPPSLP
jgi:dipeptidyl aminopeptidase/acylaminoacyl peptidase